MTALSKLVLADESCMSRASVAIPHGHDGFEGGPDQGRWWPAAVDRAQKCR